MRYYFLLAVFTLLNHVCLCDWVWTPEIGWINSRYDSRTMAQALYNQAKEAMAQQQYEEATTIFRRISEECPNVPEGRGACYQIAECQYALENYYEAYLAYEEYLKNYPQSPDLPKILDKEYEIGTILIQGKEQKRKVAVVSVLSSGSLGLEVLKKVIKVAPFAEFADDAMLLIGNYYLHQKEYLLAEEAYNRLIKEYPQSEWLSYAQYQMVMCALEQFRGLPYDPEFLLLAEKRVKEYITRYPEGSQSKLARQTYQEIRNTLAQKELEAALFYLDQGYEISARIYLAYIVQEFKETPTALVAKDVISRIQNGHK
jgi:outer membrane protein assembly factor BamD (BamD/ComL family)